jgi:hypothetical protein
MKTKETIDKMFSKIIDDPTLPESDKVIFRQGREEAMKKVASGVSAQEVLLDIFKATAEEIRRRSESN